MKRNIPITLTLLLFLQLALPLQVFATNSDFVPDPQTTYAVDFIRDCEGQQWFLNAVETILNQSQRTINRLASASDLNLINSLGLADQNITGKIPKAIGELRNLEYLFLSGNSLTGALPDGLFQLTRLQNIDLSGNLYNGAIPIGFGGMSSLTHLNLAGNAYTGTIPVQLLQHAGMVFFDVRSNALQGPFPDFSAMISLQYLNVSDNTWTGPLTDFSALPDLLVLSAWGCGLTGEIHPSLYGLAKLQILDIAQNGLSGPIQSRIGDLAELQALSLADNQLEGEIPAAIGSLVKLQSLALSNNKLRGLIPDAFTGSELMEIHLEHNFLRGTIPATLLARHSAGAKVYVSNNYLTGSDMQILTQYEQNFSDGAANEQYQLITSSTPVKISQTATADLCPFLKNRSYTTGNTTQKLRLLPEEYTVAVTNGDPAWVTITRDQNGIYILANQEIPLNAGFQITVQILGNDGSAYSKTIITLTTDTVQAQDPGGGDVTPPSPAETHAPYITGFPDNTFHDGDQVTREQMATMIIRALEITPGSYYSSDYSDVQTTDWAFSFITESTQRGYGEGRFGPQNPMTRAELATLLVRIAEDIGKESGQAETSFPDVFSDDWFDDSVRKAAQLGLVTGYEDGSFRPQNTVTRAEAVTMINRMLGRNPETTADLKTEENPFTDLKGDHWAYWQILEASMTHEH